MEHIAIMKKSWGLTGKILSGKKRIESRWYLSRRAPWDKVKKGETVYFKDSGAPVTFKATIRRVEQFSDLTPLVVKKVFKKCACADGIEKRDMPKFYERFKNKRYCILIFLGHPRKIKPFAINKRGFGLMSAWVSVAKVSKIKKNI